MRRFLALIANGAVLATMGFGQDVKPKPVDDDVVKITTNLIQVDVTVTGKDGKAVEDLRPDEIEIYENGKLQKITAFSFVRGTRLTEQEAKANREAEKKSGKEAQVYLPSGPVRPENIRRTIALKGKVATQFIQFEIVP